MRFPTTFLTDGYIYRAEGGPEGGPAGGGPAEAALQTCTDDFFLPPLDRPNMGPLIGGCLLIGGGQLLTTRRVGGGILPLIHKLSSIYGAGLSF